MRNIKKKLLCKIIYLFSWFKNRLILKITKLDKLVVANIAIINNYYIKKKY